MLKQKPALLLVAALAILICVSNLEFSEQIEKDSLIRIHVLANSDSQADLQL